MSDAETGHPVLMVSGLLFGTRAAADCLVDSGCMDEARRLAHGDLASRNLQIVVSTKVIDDGSGPPRIVAVHVW
jgi:hypothetical protein